MKTLITGFLFLTTVQAFAADGAFVYNGKRLKDNSKEAILFFNEMKSAELSGKRVNICYVGDWTIAQDAFSDSLSFSILRVSQKQKLNVKVYNVIDGQSTYGVIPVCRKTL